MTAYEPYQSPADDTRAPAYGPAPINTFAIVSFVLALVGVNVVAIVFGHISRRQIRERGERGDGFALAGLIVGYLSVVFMVVAIVALVASANQ